MCLGSVLLLIAHWGYLQLLTAVNNFHHEKLAPSELLRDVVTMVVD